MPKFDLNGDPIPDNGPAVQSPPPALPGQSYGQQPYAQAPPQPQYQQPLPTGPILPGASTGSSVDPVKIVAGIVVVTLVILGAGWAIAVTHPPAVPAPASYIPTIIDGGLVIDRPAGWDMTPIDKTQGSTAVVISGGTVFRNHTAMIEVANGTPRDMAGGNIMDVVSALNNDPGEMTAIRYRRLAKNHLWGYRTIDTQYGGKTQAFRYYRRETFTADHPAWSIGGPVKGYFLSEANTFNSVAVVLECRASDWPTLQPVFDHVIASIDVPGRQKEDDTPSQTSPTIPQIPPGVAGGGGLP